MQELFTDTEIDISNIVKGGYTQKRLIATQQGGCNARLNYCIHSSVSSAFNQSDKYLLFLSIFDENQAFSGFSVCGGKYPIKLDNSRNEIVSCFAEDITDCFDIQIPCPVIVNTAPPVNGSPSKPKKCTESVVLVNDLIQQIQNKESIDIGIVNITVEPQNITRGEPIIISVFLKNYGRSTKLSENDEIVSNIGPFPIQKPFHELIGYIEHGETKVFKVSDFSSMNFKCCGPFAISANISIEGDQNPKNDYSEKIVNIQPDLSSYVDLVMENFVVYPKTIHVNESVYFSGKVRNIGNATVYAGWELIFYVQGKNMGIGAFFLMGNALQPNESFEFGKNNSKTYSLFIVEGGNISITGEVYYTGDPFPGNNKKSAIVDVGLVNCSEFNGLCCDININKTGFGCQGEYFIETVECRFPSRGCCVGGTCN